MDRGAGEWKGEENVEGDKRDKMDNRQRDLMSGERGKRAWGGG